MRRDAKIELLKNVPLFSGCSGKELAQIAAVADEVSLPAGRDLTKEGARGREFAIIVDGAAEVRKGGRRVNTLEAGDFLGELALLTDRPRSATVTTTEPSRVLLLTDRDFHELLRSTPSLPAKLLAAVARRLED